MEETTLQAIAREAERCAEAAAPAHDFSHVLRVAKNARQIARAVGADETACHLAALLHELFNYPKDHPESHRSGDVCAEHARQLLTRHEVKRELIDLVCEAIRDHAFSKGAAPKSLVAKVLQDADRLDAIGAIGIARCMATCSEMRRPFYAPHDPFCAERIPSDKEWGIDHFFTKLLKIPERLHTEPARRMADERVKTMRTFLSALEREIS